MMKYNITQALASELSLSQKNRKKLKHQAVAIKCNLGLKKTNIFTH